MALDTLKDKRDVGGFLINHYVNGEWVNDDLEGFKFIEIDHDANEITFRIQNKPIKEAGLNGCQVDTIVEAAKLIIEGLNAQYPCRENSLAITKLDEALMWLRERTRSREKRGVEGTSKE